MYHEKNKNELNGHTYFYKEIPRQIQVINETCLCYFIFGDTSCSLEDRAQRHVHSNPVTLTRIFPHWPMVFTFNKERWTDL